VFWCDADGRDLKLHQQGLSDSQLALSAGSQGPDLIELLHRQWKNTSLRTSILRVMLLLAKVLPNYCMHTALKIDVRSTFSTNICFFC